MNQSAIRAAAREIVRDSAPRPGAHPDDSLNAFDRKLVGGERVRLQFPLLNPVQARQHLMIAKAELERAIALLGAPERADRSLLLAVQGIIRSCNRTINARWRKMPDLRED